VGLLNAVGMTDMLVEIFGMNSVVRISVVPMGLCGKIVKS
jgi:hypothetical protein